MKNLSADSKLQRLLRVFQRAGGQGAYTRPFVELPTDVQIRLMELAMVRSDELPIIAYFRAPTEWVLVTTERVIIRQAGGGCTIPWSELKDATTDISHVNGALEMGAGGKLDLSRLKLIRHEGEAIEVELEAGRSFFGFWNVLKSISSATVLASDN
ncbi:hypothetical protein JQX13_53380 [Archangium violaceum]|uniref:hypothetical protein n=1 Tax=Archangium violaceum TaxID=83451 RepID=UPI00193B0F5C|nr:hypothetical protein [Archangium violaceum]QRK08592.1 hypothetical protein JQX13_53380 [Archangium violaceum]